jgi:hypothetical protein
MEWDWDERAAANRQHREPPTLDAIEQLAMSADIGDRAFAASVLSMRRRSEDSERVAALYERLHEGASGHHEEVRRRLRAGTLDRQALLARLLAAPLAIRDHLVEEILGIAYPPLLEPELPPDAIPYCPSGLVEIQFMLERAGLGPGKTFVDLGSGLGKVVLLVALLTGARAYGMELDPHLVRRARAAAQALSLDGALFLEGDIRDAPLPAADVYYMYIPLTDSAAVVGRLAACAAERKVCLFSQALNLTHVPWLAPSRASSHWLEMYEGLDRPRGSWPSAYGLADRPDHR